VDHPAGTPQQRLVVQPGVDHRHPRPGQQPTDRVKPGRCSAPGLAPVTRSDGRWAPHTARPGGVGERSVRSTRSGLRRIVLGETLDGVDELGGDGAQFDVAPLRDRPQGRERCRGVTAPLGHHDSDCLVDD
jgi:hypothetical protein